jgi:hypothetical protein
MWKFLKNIGKLIMNLFTVNGELSIDTSNVYVDGKQADLSVCHIKQSDYDELVKTDSCISNTIYIVESEYVNAYNQQVKNVADPIDPQDAVTLKYIQENIKVPEIDESKFVLKSQLKDLVKEITIDLLKN